MSSSSPQTFESLGVFLDKKDASGFQTNTDSFGSFGVPHFDFQEETNSLGSSCPNDVERQMYWIRLTDIFEKHDKSKIDMVNAMIFKHSNTLDELHEFYVKICGVYHEQPQKIVYGHPQDMPVFEEHNTQQMKHAMNDIDYKQIQAEVTQEYMVWEHPASNKTENMLRNELVQMEVNKRVLLAKIKLTELRNAWLLDLLQWNKGMNEHNIKEIKVQIKSLQEVYDGLRNNISGT